MLLVQVLKNCLLGPKYRVRILKGLRCHHREAVDSSTGILRDLNFGEVKCGVWQIRYVCVCITQQGNGSGKSDERKWEMIV